MGKNMEKVFQDSVIRTQDGSLEDKLTAIMGGRYRVYRDAWRAACHISIPPFPLHVDLELMDDCNSSCTFCPRNKKTHPNVPYSINTKQTLPDSLLEKFLCEATELALYSINIAVGEPLLDSRCLSVIKEFHANGGVDSRVNTNGVLLDTVIDQIFDSGLVNLFVSLDAFSDETYRSLRGGVGRYQKVVDNILLMLEEKKRRKSVLPVMRVSFIETDINSHEADDFLTFWREKVEIVDVHQYLQFNNLVGGKKQKKWHCIDPFRRLCIMANGDILPCCTFYGKLLSLGHFETTSLAEAWKGEKLVKVRDELIHDNNKICLACQEC
jgi:radical SAM protein with 4Fe4S-binding SPASM domain